MLYSSIRSSVSVALTLGLTLAASGQTLKLASHQEKLTHGTGEDRKQAVLRYPEVVDPAHPEVEREANRALSLKSVIHQSLEEIKGDFQSSSWLTNLDYKVIYSGRGVLSLVYTMDGVAAYPSTNNYYVNVDTRTGRAITPVSAFRAEALGPLVKKLDAMRAEEVRQAVAHELSYGSILKGTPPFTRDSLARFTLDARGVTFHFDYGLPHVTQAAAPPGEFFLSYASLRSQIRPDGPLAGFRSR